MRLPSILSDSSKRKKAKLTDAHMATVRELHVAMALYHSEHGGAHVSKARGMCQFLKLELGEAMWELLVLVIYGDRGFGEVERELGWAARSAKVVFRIALDQTVYKLKGYPGA